MLPFSKEQFFEVFRRYNEAVWPAQFVLLCLVVLAIASAMGRRRWSGVFISGVLAALWLWMAVVYHIVFFSAINPLSVAFGLLFVVQAALFIHFGVLQQRLSFGISQSWSTVLGACLLLYALIVYPLLGPLFGHSYPRAPTFGVPCPTTIFTFGLLRWTRSRVPIPVLIVPVLWAAIGTTAAFLLGVWEDLGLLAAGVLGVMSVRRFRNSNERFGKEQG